MSISSTVATFATHLRLTIYDDVMTWKCFPCYWPFTRGIHRSPLYFPHNEPVSFFFCSKPNGQGVEEAMCTLIFFWRKWTFPYYILSHCDVTTHIWVSQIGWHTGPIPRMFSHGHMQIGRLGREAGRFCISPKETDVRGIRKILPLNTQSGTYSSQWRHKSVSNHRRLKCLFNGLFSLTTNKSSNRRITGPLWGESAGDKFIDLTLRCHNVNMLCIMAIRGTSKWMFMCLAFDTLEMIGWGVYDPTMIGN